VSRLIAIVGPTATGKSALAIAVAQEFSGEIVACDSTAVYRGIDIGTDKVPDSAQGGVRHHLVDLVDVSAVYSAAEYARDAARTIRGILARGRVPVLAGGTGFYYRALVRGLFPGPSRDDELRRRLDRVADRRGVGRLWAWLHRVDPASAARIMPRDQKRIVRALEVYLLTGRPLTDHFEATRSPIPDVEVLALGLDVNREELEARVTRRVDAQLAAGVVDEVRSLLAGGLSPRAHALTGLVYRQVVEHLAGERDLAATRDLIIRENMRYARRQRAWFAKEPGVRRLQGPGESPAARDAASHAVGAFLRHADGPVMTIPVWAGEH
jgi:tRNA dimethylallyltransferase